MILPFSEQYVDIPKYWAESANLNSRTEDLISVLICIYYNDYRVYIIIIKIYQLKRFLNLIE